MPIDLQYVDGMRTMVRGQFDRLLELKDKLQKKFGAQSFYAESIDRLLAAGGELEAAVPALIKSQPRQLPDACMEKFDQFMRLVSESLLDVRERVGEALEYGHDGKAVDVDSHELGDAIVGYNNDMLDLLSQFDPAVKIEVLAAELQRALIFDLPQPEMQRAIASFNGTQAKAHEVLEARKTLKTGLQQAIKNNLTELPDGLRDEHLRFVEIVRVLGNISKDEETAALRHTQGGTTVEVRNYARGINGLAQQMSAAFGEMVGMITTLNRPVVVR